MMDLAEGHMAALNFIKARSNWSVINLGTGKASSVFELVSTFERVSGQRVKKAVTKRRAGDLPIYYAGTNRALSLLEWRAMRSLEDMCQSTWDWQKWRLNNLH